MRVVERRVHRIRGERAGIVAVELHERRREFPGARMTRGEGIRLELVTARPERAERRHEEGEDRHHQHEEQECRVRRRYWHAERRVEAGLPGEPAEHGEPDEHRRD